MDVLSRLVTVMQRDRPAVLYVDASEGVGHTLATTLPGLAGVPCPVIPVNFGGPALDPDRYANVRAEIWDKMRKWFERGASIFDEPYTPGQPTLASEVLALHRRPQDEKRLLLEKKAEVIKRIGVSPDGADALAMTFYYPDPDMNIGDGNVYTPSPLDTYDAIAGPMDDGNVTMGEVAL